MKKIIILTLLLLMPASAMFAQNGKSIYNKYSDTDNVSAVYISPAMFSMIGKLPTVDIDKEQVDLSSLIKSLEGFYLIDSENEKVNAALKEDVAKMVEKGYYELLMEAKDDHDIVHIYTIGDEKTVTSLLLCITEEKECTFICMDGKMERTKLQNALSETAGKMDK